MIDTFDRSIKDDYVTLEKAEEQQKEFKLEFKKMVKGSRKSENQTCVINNIKTL